MGSSDSRPQRGQSLFEHTKSSMKKSYRTGQEIARNGFQETFGSRTRNCVELIGVENNKRQYRITGKARERKLLTWRKATDGTAVDSKGTPRYYDVEATNVEKATLFDDLQISISARIHSLILWTFHRNLFLVIFCFSITFVILTIIFAFVIVGLIKIFGQSHCLSTEGNYDDLPFIGKVNDAWILSWSTFSTVGYGLVSPLKSNNAGDRCLFLDWICSFESFLGTIFAGSCAAILYSRVIRFQKKAQITLSDFMTVQFGNQLLSAQEQEKVFSDSDDELLQISQSETNCNFPVMSFRIVNLFHSIIGGEIIDGRVSLMADVDLQKNLDPEKQTHAGNTHFRNHFIKLRSDKRKSDKEDQDQEEDSQPKMVFAKVDVTPYEHPFFKRVWRVSFFLSFLSFPSILTLFFL